MIRFILLAFIGSALFLSCKQQQPKSNLTEKDYIAFGKKLDSIINTGNDTYLASCIDVSRLSDTVISRQQVGVLSKSQLKKGLEQGLSSAFSSLSTRIANIVSTGGDYQFMYYHQKNDHPHAMFRMNSSEGINYHDMLLYDDNGTISDIYVYLSGELVSTSVSNVLQLGITSSNALTTEFDQSSLEHLSKPKELSEEGRYQEAYDAVEALPENLRKAKSMQVLKLTLAMQLGEELYLKTMQDYEKFYPNDPSLNLVLLDVYYLKEDYRKALQCVDRLDKDVKDPYLDLFRGNIHYEMGDIAAAEKSFRNVITKVGRIDRTPFLSLTIVCLEQDKFAEAIEVMDMICEKFDMTNTEVADMFAGYERFYQSRELNDWLKSDQLSTEHSE